MKNYQLSIKIHVTYLLLIGLFSSCFTESEVEKNDFLKRISGNLRLELVHMNSEYGEWGGDLCLIKIYEEEYRKQKFRLVADLIEVKGELGPPPPPDLETHVEIRKGWSVEKSKYKRSNKIGLSEKDLVLVQNAILEFADYHLSSDNVISHAGNWNQVFLSDSTFIIEDYPSFNWPKFQELKSNLEKQKK